MEQIRFGVFETNSSSMHSLVVRKDETFYKGENNYYTQKDVRNEVGRVMTSKGVLYSWNGDWYFGRSPFRILNTFLDKFTYAFASLVGENDKATLKETDEYKMLFDILRKYEPDLTDIDVPSFFGTDDYMFKDWLIREDITVEEFLINKKYVVICDGDEYCIWEDLKHSGIINTDMFKEVV